MICACGGDTAVIDSRPVEVAGVAAIRRRRRCVTCRETFNTWESAVNPTRTARELEAFRKAARLRYEAVPLEQRAAAKKRERLRTAARAQAAEEGVAAADVYARWGLA